MKISYWKEKLIFTAAYLGLVVGLWWLGVPCLFQAALQIPCPGCGMTRALLAVLRLDFAAAFAFHPMVWSLPILYAYFLLDRGIFRHKLWDGAVLIGIAAGFLAQWLWQIFAG